jgi:hypothetical protein
MHFYIYAAEVHHTGRPELIDKTGFEAFTQVFAAILIGNVEQASTTIFIPMMLLINKYVVP